MDRSRSRSIRNPRSRHGRRRTPRELSVRAVHRLVPFPPPTSSRWPPVAPTDGATRGATAGSATRAMSGSPWGLRSPLATAEWVTLEGCVVAKPPASSGCGAEPPRGCDCCNPGGSSHHARATDASPSETSSNTSSRPAATPSSRMSACGPVMMSTRARTSDGEPPGSTHARTTTVPS